MKKILTAIMVCFLFASFSFASAVPLTKNLEPNNKINALDTEPVWADGTFTGTWGIREYDPFLDALQDIFGEADNDSLFEHTIGNISGYYGNLFGIIYLFKGTAYHVNETGNETVVTSFSGLSIGHIVGGVLGDVNLTVEPDEGEDYLLQFEEANYCGIGAHNNTKFDWRIMGVKGPTLFMQGKTSLFQ